MARMRTVFRSELDDFSHDLIAMCDSVRLSMEMASTALLDASLQDAEEALSMADSLETRRQRCEERAVQLLALEAPVASDLRQVLSSIDIVEDFDRMAALSMHIAKAARRRHPKRAIPDDVVDHFKEYARLVDEMAQKTRELLVDPDADVALVLSRDDDAVDEINNALLFILTEEEWEVTIQEAVDTALLSRFYERWADHCVNVAARIIFLTTGLMPEEYQSDRSKQDDNPEGEIREHYQEISRKIARYYRPDSSK